jgi:hypothetical protein
LATGRSSVPQFHTYDQLQPPERGKGQLTMAETDCLCLLIDMIKDTGISNTEIGDDLEGFSASQLEASQGHW